MGRSVPDNDCFCGRDTSAPVAGLGPAAQRSLLRHAAAGFRASADKTPGRASVERLESDDGTYLPGGVWPRWRKAESSDH
jgi:hypothetical protein